jgi:hypothetical protein
MGGEVEQVMEKQLDKLVRLAALDAEIARLQQELGKIPAAVEAVEGKYLAAEKTLEEAKEELSSMQKEHRKAEGDLDGHIEKIRKLNHQTSLVKTNKEYQALLGEIDNQKKEQDGYEERILELMEKSAEYEQRISVAEGEVREAKAVFEREEALLQAEGEKLKRELQEVENSREELMGGINPENIQVYTRVKVLRGDSVAEVRNEICLGCRVSIPPQKYADVITSDEPQTCSRCQRILYFRKDRQAPAKDSE